MWPLLYQQELPVASADVEVDWDLWDTETMSKSLWSPHLGWLAGWSSWCWVYDRWDNSSDQDDVAQMTLTHSYWIRSSEGWADAVEQLVVDLEVLWVDLVVVSELVDPKETLKYWTLALSSEIVSETSFAVHVLVEHLTFPFPFLPLWPFWLHWFDQLWFWVWFQTRWSTYPFDLALPLPFDFPFWFWKRLEDPLTLFFLVCIRELIDAFDVDWGCIVEVVD